MNQIKIKILSKINILDMFKEEEEVTKEEVTISTDMIKRISNQFY
jgi:hypothetical protein